MIAWKANVDEALVGYLAGVAIAGVWRGAWRSSNGELAYGCLAAVWVPAYRRVGRFSSAREAMAAVEAALA